MDTRVRAYALLTDWDYFNVEYYTGSVTIGTNTLPNIAKQNLFFTKLNSSGEVIMAKNHGNAEDTEIGHKIDTDDNGNIYILGSTAPHMGASEYFRGMDIKDKGIIPKVDMSLAKRTFYAVSEAVKKSYVVSCHDCSEGGLAVALSEMCLSSGKGASVFLGEVPAKGKLLNYEILFSESPSRFVVEVRKDKKNKFEDICKDIPFGLAGCVASDKKLVVYGLEGDAIINGSLDEFYEAWTGTFKDFR